MVNLLIIDDEESLANNLKSYLERKGYSVTCTQTAEAGLKLLESQDFDILLLDLHLKGELFGTEVLKKALEIRPQLKILIFTGFGSDQELKDICINLGAKTYLKKPLSLSKLKEELDKLCQT